MFAKIYEYDPYIAASVVKRSYACHWTLRLYHTQTGKQPKARLVKTHIASRENINPKGPTTTTEPPP